MRRISLLLFTLAAIGCSDTKAPVVVEFRGNPISGALTGTLRAAGGPYLATDTLIVPAGQELIVEAGTELRFEPKIPLLVYGKITAIGTEIAPITFTSGLKYPSRGDWDGVWLIGADNASRFEYTRFLFGAKYGRRYTYRTVNSQVDSTVYEYGCLTLLESSPQINHSWFIASGFHGVHCDSASSPRIENSVFYDNAGHGVYIRWDANPQISYNIIIENDDYGVFCAERGEVARNDVDLNYNIVWSNFSGEFNSLSPIRLGRIAQANGNLDSCDYRFNLRANPGFTDAESWDFRLTACSGAIDAGPATPLDADGTRLELGIYPYRYRPGEIRRLITIPTLLKANSPYYMSCDVFLPKGQNLNIEPGVEVRVEGLYAFQVMGQLRSSGTPAQPIKFYSASTTPKKGDWIGFMFPNGGDEGSILESTSILHARWGVRLVNQDIQIHNCTISESDSVGIFCESNASPDINTCKLANNSIAGVICQFNSSPDIGNCVISGGAGYGVLAIESSRPDIHNSVFSMIGTDGIRLANLSNAKISNNVFYRNGYFGLYCFNNSSPDVRNNIFFRNGSELRGGVGIFALRSSQPVIEYNTFWGQPLTPVSISGDTTAFSRATSVLSDPMFVNGDAGDWHLKAGSLSINAGDFSPIWNDTDGSRNDIGAYGGPRAGN